MERAMQQVADFQTRIQAHPSVQLDATDGLPAAAESVIHDLRDSVKYASARLEDWMADRAPTPQELRVHLIAEEFGELLTAMLSGNELLTLDALADLTYVVVGTAVTFDLPLPAAFEEVHRSNMTKERQPDDPSADRVRAKGPNYDPPDLVTVLQDHRKDS
jgi:NTP pyrophosphatase (non-canonical NTP hydrolase)